MNTTKLFFIIILLGFFLFLAKDSILSFMDNLGKPKPSSTERQVNQGMKDYTP